MTFLSKARAFTLGNMHDLLDKAIDVNSPAVLKQYVRDLESAISQLQTEAAVQAGGVRTLNREIGDLRNNIQTKTASIKTRLASPNVTNQDSIVRSWAAQVTEWQKELDQKVNQDLPAQAKTALELDGVVSKLDIRHSTMVAQVRRLESTVHTTTAKEHAVSALKSATSLAAGADGISIDNLAAKVQSRADVADEKFDRVVNSETLSESAEQSADVDAFLSNLK